VWTASAPQEVLEFMLEDKPAADAVVDEEIAVEVLQESD
jgi:hypothetical protein